MTDTCPPKAYCVMYGLVKEGESKVPYTTYASTEEDPEVECVEHGILSIKNSQLIDIERKEYDHVPSWVLANQS